MAYISKGKKTNQNILKAVIKRQIYGANAIQDVCLIRTMIESERTFKKVFDMPSRSPIVYQSDRLYFDSFSTCYDLVNAKIKPRILYTLPRRAARTNSLYKTEEMLSFESPLDQTTFCKVVGTFYANGPYSIGLTADNYLKVFDFKTGKSLEQVYLMSGRKFKYLNWETDLDRIVVQSTLVPQTSTHDQRLMQRVPTQTNPVLLYLAIFNVTPIEFICMLPISLKIFGTSACNATARNGMLFVMHRQRKMQLFSLEDILKNQTIPVKLGESLKPGNSHGLPEMDEFTSGIVGVSPLGLPNNVILLEKPSILFEVESDNHELSVGGYPWHYIVNNKQVFEVRSVRNHSLAENGTLSNNVLSLWEKVFFHEDHSGRVLFVTPLYLRCLQLDPTSPHQENATHKLNEQFILDYRQSDKVSNIVETKSGRKVKQKFSSYHGNLELEVVHDFDYDDELDLLVVLYRSPNKGGEGIVGFYDNQTGRDIHQFCIAGLNELAEHSIAIDRNTVVIVSRYKHKFSCLAFVI